MPNQKNIDLVKIISEKLARAKAVISIEYHKLDANKINDLRSRLASEGSEVSVVKNTLLKIALKEKKAGEELIKHLDGPNATIFAYGDAISPIKALYAFVKQFEWRKLRDLRRTAAYNGFQVRIKGKKISYFLKKLLNISRRGLKKRKKNEEVYLDALFERVSREKSPADRAIAWFKKGGVPLLLKNASLKKEQLRNLNAR